ncbi:MAG: pilus assembly protein [Flavimaricola sp.]|nr:pilus assembly protein [Flavimaricola sp.]
MTIARQMAISLLSKGLSKIAGPAQRLRRDQEGSVSVEAILMLPLLIWAFLGTWVFFDAYKAQFVNAKAGYTIGDILSRETGFVTPEYMDSLYNLQQFLVERGDPIRLRLSVITYDEDNDSYEVRWSRNRGGGGVITDSDVEEMRDMIPIMADGSSAIIVQTSMEYIPIYRNGLSDLVFDDFVVTRPRFAGQLCWNSSNTSTSQSTATC